MGRRVVVGGGLFGAHAALILSSKGHDVVLIERDDDILRRASHVNQARLHTGLHYPRSLLTARETLNHYRRFRQEFPAAVRDFRQIYAIARHGSKTSADSFRTFIDRLGLDVEEIPTDRWFHPGTVDVALQVEEPTFDASVLRREFSLRLRADRRIKLRLGENVHGASRHRDEILIRTSNGIVACDGLVVAAYAGTNPMRDGLGLNRLPLAHELTEVVLGRVESRLSGVGFTVMDGPFWSLMPFGSGDVVSLTSVGLTPAARAGALPTFDCQSLNTACSPQHLMTCSSCAFRPATNDVHHRQQMAMFLRWASDYHPMESLWTVKTILKTTEVDDARPTVVHKEPDEAIWTIFSGKVSTLFELEERLS